ncbi:RNA polymerase sigma factor [Kordia zhangzhouensis]|uniref:RNA polymerase sigma factor n=1 Tax=Kordia zhangzhouensis TaxID=1620405 RepID=UPI0006299C2A|nr:sigma-70 family RNA polymerase sigma factor [Kordia zhangzhouensis]
MQSSREHYFQEVITQHKDKIYRICFAYLYEKELVEDLYQEVLINVWNGLKNFKGNAKLTTWLYRVTLNTTITFNRHHKKHLQIFNNQIPDSFEEVLDTERQAQENRVNKLMRCVQKLKKEERLIISLVLEELSYKEIAEIIGIEVNNVGVRINRIKKRLLKIYNNEGF